MQYKITFKYVSRVNGKTDEEALEEFWTELVEHVEHNGLEDLVKIQELESNDSEEED